MAAQRPKAMAEVVGGTKVEGVAQGWVVGRARCVVALLKESANLIALILHNARTVCVRLGRYGSE